MNKVMKFFLGIISLGLLTSIFLAISIYNFGWNTKAEKSQCVIILGCSVYGETPSPFLKKRIEEGYRLHKEGVVDYIIPSGGQGPGENISEAEAMKRYLLNKGVKEELIIKEDLSTSTMENLQECKKIMEEKGFEKAIIVSNKFHLKRASLMAKEVGIDGSYSGVFVEEYKSKEIYYFFREILALAKFYILKN
ncbi:YdcF family protein [Clostridium malenominatum]|uniref:YdcF family protein n=1 Tax=Clostridium malenominatum TaxID=1539 RepID=A0ABN1J0X5_9CLOT